MRNKSLSSFLLFLLGLGSATKVFLFGAIAISELVIFVIAPFLLLMKWHDMRREGFVSFLYMLAFMVAGMLVSAAWNHTPFTYAFKQFAVFYGFFSFYIVYYHLLHDNFKGLGWLFLGSFISGVITIWAFNPTAEVSSTGFIHIANAEAEDVIRGPLFWIGKVRGLGELPIVAAYLKTPMMYSIITPILFVVFALFTTITGRAQSMCVLLSGVMMLIGRKARFRMSRVGRHFWILMIIGVLTLFCYKLVYSYAAGKGYLGYDAQLKYEHQTDRGKGMLSLLVAGRTEFFIALTAIVDHPIIGFGPRAEDVNGYTEKFILKYGTESDIVGYYYYMSYYARQGLLPIIPTHSHIMGTWLWCGLPGLLFWFWVIYRMYRHIRYHISVIPQWFGYFALTIPAMLWSIFFNPITSRSMVPLLMVCMTFASAVASGRLPLPYDMEMEARKYD